MSEKSLGQVAFEAFQKILYPSQSWRPNLLKPDWDNLDDDEKEAWEAAALAACNHAS
jgi:hypothetical protein